MHHRAWLAVTPTKHKESRGVAYRFKDKNHPLLELPDVGAAQYLADYLFEVGPMTGEHSITWGELSKWREETGVELDEFGARTIINLSREYVAMLSQARDPMHPAPHAVAAERVKPSRAEVGKLLSKVLHQAAASKTTKGRT